MARGEQDRPVPWRDRLLLFSLLPLTWAVQAWTRSHPEFVENVYSRKIYPVIAEFVGTLTGWTSYSFAELLILLVVTVTLFKKFRALRGLLRKRRSLKNVAAHGLSFSLAIVGILYFWGMFGWAFNYHRQSFLVSENLDRVGITAPELQRLSLSLANEANELRRHLEEDDDGLLRLLESRRDALERGTLAFSSQGQEYETLRDGYVSRPKGPVINLLPWMHIAGVFFPYTGEANVTMTQPNHSLLFAGCHEMAHQLGWAREEEANFVGYAVCRRHPDEDYRYAAAQGALRYSLGALRAMDKDLAASVVATLGPGLRRDWEASNIYWERYDGALGENAQRVNDAYLKAQGQEEGVRSYGMMVDLLVADFRRRQPGTI